MNQSINLFNIYCNILEFLKYRKLELKDNIVNKEEFNKEIELEHFYIINTDKYKIILFNYNDYINTKFINDVIKKELKKDKNTEFIIITQTRILKTLPSNVENYFYKHFKIVVPKHILVPKYKILSNDEKNKVLEKQLISKQQEIPNILKDDAMVIWLGAKPGDILYEEFQLENCGLCGNYVFVVEK